LVESANVGARDSNMTEIRQLRLRWTECDGTPLEGAIFSAWDQVDAYLTVCGRVRTAGLLSVELDCSNQNSGQQRNAR
jgi:hypothetical protein